MNKKENLIRTSERIIDDLNNLQKRIDFLRSKMKDRKNSYEYDSSFENEYELEASILLAEKYASLIPNEFQPNRRDEIASIENELKFFIDGSWKSHEFSQFFYSINQIYQLVAVTDLALPRLRRSQNTLDTRWGVYKNASLHYFLNTQEDLRVKKIQYNSPGDIEFLSYVAQNAPELMRHVLLILTLVKIVPNFLQKVPTIYRHWVEEINKAKEIRRKEEIKGLIQEFFLKRFREIVKQNLNPDEIEKSSEAINLLIDNIQKVSDENIVDGIKLTQNTFEALSSLSHLYQNKKIEIQEK